MICKSCEKSFTILSMNKFVSNSSDCCCLFFSISGQLHQHIQATSTTMPIERTNDFSIYFMETPSPGHSILMLSIFLFISEVGVSIFVAHSIAMLHLFLVCVCVYFFCKLNGTLLDFFNIWIILHNFYSANNRNWHFQRCFQHHHHCDTRAVQF